MKRAQYFSFIALLCFILGFSTNMEAQLNFSVGFSSGKAYADNLNNIVAGYNSDQVPKLEEELGSLVWLNGVNLGFRQKFDNVAFFVSWNNLRRVKTAFGQDTLNQFLEKKLKYSMNTYDLGIENYTGIFAYGFSIGRRSFDIKTPIASSDRDRVVSNESIWVSRFHVSINSNGGAYSSIVLKPYFEYAWGDSDLTAFNTELRETKPGLKEKIHLIGLSIIFYNGGQ